MTITATSAEQEGLKEEAVFYSDSQIYSLLRPYVAEWFRRRYRTFTAPQRGAIPLIKMGKNVLVSSPTGTGKTLAVFLGILDNLYGMWERGELQEAVYVVYVSPLRALNNDIRRNLLEPIEGIRKVAEEEFGLELPEIRVGVRTSDTKPSEKQRMLRRPPHILLTTPESLANSLVAPKFRERLKGVRWVIVDEIHELASSKRGAHLSLSLERLEELVRSSGGRLQRIGLSATIAPLDEVARFLVGFDDSGRPREVSIVDARFAKPIDIKVLTPKVDLIYGDPEKINESIYRILADLIKRHRTTLVFTNTRSATERVVYKLKKLLAEEKIVDMDEVEAHHSSLSRDLRLEVEEKLKRGQLRVVVSSTSLELGIDIGYIDLVVLLSSPKSVTRMLQRIGRAGHHIREVSKGRVIVVDRDDLVECAVLAKLARERFIDRVRIPRNPLDVLAQHIVGMAVERKWRLEEAYRLVKRSYSFHTLDWDTFMSVIRYLAYGHGLEDEKVYPKIWLDEEEGVFGRKRGVRMIYLLNSGTIPDESKIVVLTSDGRYVGNLEEDFVEILTPGDIFVLGGRTYRFLRSEGMKVFVEPAEGLRPTVPSWYSEMLPLSFDSALKVGEFRRILGELIKRGDRRKAYEILTRDYELEPHAAKTIIDYFEEQVKYVGIVPSDRTILIEFYFDEDGTHIIFHALYGRRVVDALSRFYAKLFSEELASPVRVTVTDNGFMLTLPPRVRVSREVIERILERSLREDLRRSLEEVIANTELMKRRFRHVAQRSFMILRRYRGREKSPERLQLSAERLLSIMLRNFPDSPVVRETFREILEDYMDVSNAEKVLEWIRRGEVEVKVVGPLPYPSPFAHNIVARGYSDVVLMEDRRRLIARLHRKVLEIIKRRSGGD